MNAHICPCCERPLDHDQPVKMRDLLEARASDVQRRIIQILIDAHPRKLRLCQLVDAVYQHDPNGGPMTADTTIRVHIHKLRAALAPFGWTVPRNFNGQNGIGLYGLAPIDAPLRAKRK